jgi:hypothetical protein
MNNGYSICFNEWALDKEIKNELGLLLIISSLCAEKGYCYASNEYFAELFGIDEVSVSRKIKLLERKNYISVEYEKRGCEVKNRFLRLTKMLTDDLQKNQSTINKNVKENNISNNIISNNIKENSINNKLLILKESENLFKMFWSVYPKKRDKGSAEKWFNKNNPSKDLVDLMIKQIERFKDTEDWKKENGKFIPYPASWLNGKMWEDEFETITEQEERLERELLDGIEGC